MKKLVLTLVLLISICCFSQEKKITTFTPIKVTFFFSSSKIVMKYDDMTPEIVYTISYKRREDDVDIYLIEGSDTVIVKGVLNGNQIGFIQIQTSEKNLTLIYKLK